jgi:hypothetical protein
LKSTLINARQEIIQLRRANEILQAQMAVVDVFAAALGLEKGQMGMSPDVAWELQREIERLESEEKEKESKKKPSR